MSIKEWMKGWKRAIAVLVLCIASTSGLRAEEPKKEEAPAAAAAAPAAPEAKKEDPHVKADPSGASVGSDYGPDFSGAAKPGEPTNAEIAAQVTKLRGGLNLFWTCLAGFLVFFMQAGFAMVETGFTRAKNASHTMLMNMMVFCIGFIGYYICGFAFMFGGFGALGTLGGANIQDGMFSIGGWNLIGTKGFFMSGFFDSQVLAFYMFQMVFMDTAATIPTGSMAERIKFSAFIWMSFFLTMFTYPIIGCWVWGGGWLAQLGAKANLGWGAVDFSGSGVIHMVGGWTALAGAIILGPRIGKYDKDGNARPIPGHDIPMAIIGTIILFFGWFGFNPGSTLAATDGIISVAAVNTMIAGVFGGFSAMLYMMYVHPAKKPDPGMCCNGVLAGLVAITAPCAFVSPTASVLIGLIAGVWVIIAAMYVENTLKIDDPVGAFAVHGCNGLLGVLCVGLFACGTYGSGLNGVAKVMVAGKEWTGGVLGLLPIGAPEGTPWGYTGQLWAQLVFAVADIAFVLAIEFAFFKVYHAVFGLRVSAEDELAGLDIPETGCPAYPDFVSRDHFGTGSFESAPVSSGSPVLATAKARTEPA